MEARRRQLYSHFNLGALHTVVLPAAVQLATFIPMTYLFLYTAMPPTPLDSESFLHLTTLTHYDPSNILPVAIGILNMANVDSHRWMLQPTRFKEQRQVEQNVVQAQLSRGGPSQKAKYELKFRPSGIMASAARCLSVLRIIVAMQMPGVRVTAQCCFTLQGG
jgi:mitochondrial inner membrane protein COX18